MEYITSKPKVLSVVIPVYNEQATIRSVIAQVILIPYLLEIIAVNDGSDDGTDKVLEELALEFNELKVIHHPKNKGKTTALKTGFRATQGDIVIVQDADLEYNPLSRLVIR